MLIDKTTVSKRSWELLRKMNILLRREIRYTYNPSNIFARARLVLTRHVGEYSPAETGEYPRIFSNFQNCARCVKYLKKTIASIRGENMLGYLSLDIICSS